MNKKLNILNEKLAELKKTRADLEARLEGESNPTFKNMIQAGIDKNDTEIASVELSIKEVAAYAEITEKDWEKIGKEYPIVAQGYKDTMKISDDIKINTDLYRQSKRLAEKGQLPSMLLYGPTGTGKTTFFRVLGKEINRPVISVNASNGMKEEDVFGSFTIGEDGKPKFVYGPLTIAMITGAIFVIEEINGAKPSVILKLNSVLDDLGQVYIKETGEVIKAAPGFMLGGTFNPGYAGTRKMNKAFQNRFYVVGNVDEMSQTQLLDVLRHKVPNVTDEELNVSWLVFKGIQNQLKAEDLDGAISVRQMVSMILYYRVYNDNRENKAKQRSWTQAINNAVKGQVSGGDLDINAKIDLVIQDLLNKTGKDGKLKEEANPVGEVLGSLKDVQSRLKGLAEEK